MRLSKKRDESASRWEEKCKRQRGVSGCRDFYELEETEEIIGLSFRKNEQERKLQFVV